MTKISFLGLTSLLAAASTLSAELNRDGFSYRTRADNGVYTNLATSPNNMAYGFNNATEEWRTVFAFDLDTEDDGINDFSGYSDITLNVDFANAPGTGDDDYEFVFLGSQAPQTSAIFGAGTNYPFSVLFGKAPVDYDSVALGSQTFQETVASGSTDVSYDIDWLADISVSATDNVVFFAVRTVAGSFAAQEASSARFSSNTDVAGGAAPITPNISAVPEPSTFGLLAGCFAMLLVMARRRS